jgi:uncharacterized repeat protein (TIGR01451 family)
VQDDPNIPGRTWSPPGIAKPWPRDEYLCDGGDKDVPVAIGSDWRVNGLNLEDTVAHYDTLDGRTVVEPTNCVCIYAPRFAAVRKVYGIVQNRQREPLAGVEIPTGPAQRDETLIPSTTLQQLQLHRQVGRKQPTIFRERQRGLDVDNVKVVAGFEHGFKPYEDFQVIRIGTFDQTEKARLAESIAAAVAWTSDQSVHVILDDQPVVVNIGIQAVQQTEMYERTGKPRLCVIKLASKHHALPGELVDFTIRFDNTGTQPIGNVTIIDNLTTRLEYVPGSAQSTLGADFFTLENEGESLVLRWEIRDPLEKGQGGIIRFQCRVR